VFHTLRHKEMIGLSMVDGKKAEVGASETIASSRSATGILLIGLVVTFGIYLFKNFDSQTRSLQFFGTTLQIGENENGSSEDLQGDDD